MAKYPKLYQTLTTSEVNDYLGVSDAAFMIGEICVQTATIVSMIDLCVANPAWASLVWMYQRTNDEGISVLCLRSSFDEAAQAVDCYTSTGEPITVEQAQDLNSAIIVPKGASWDF